MRKRFPLLLLAVLLGSCVSGTDSVRDSIYPDLDWVVWKKRTIRDPNNNIVDLTLIGLSKREAYNYGSGGRPEIDVHIIWNLRKKESLEYKISFTVDQGNSDFFIRTAAGGIYPVTSVRKGPTFPAALKAKQGEGGLIILTFSGFDPDRNPLFDLVEGGRQAVNTAAWKTYIKDPARWSFFGCRAVRGGRK